MKTRSIVSLLLLFGAVVAGTLLWLHQETALPGLPSGPARPPSVFAQEASADLGESRVSRRAVPSASDDAPEANEPLLVIPAFRFYDNRVRAIPEQDALWREVRMPATALKDMSKDTLRNLAVASLDDMTMGPVSAEVPDGI